MATVWQFLVLPDVLEMIKRCDDKPLCKMLRKIATKKSKPFDKNEELLRLLGYSTNDAASHTHFHHALPTMARLLLKLSSESEEIQERFKAHLEASRLCGVSASAFTRASTQTF